LYDSYRVIVGKPDSPTPVLTSAVDRIITNPVWYVPPSITMNEILPKIKSDTSYLKKNNLRIIDRSNRIINIGEVELTDMSILSFEYAIRQDAGSDNALGQVKFAFSNPYSVYLHDTPGKLLFSKDIRAFSHGCIRIENPLRLAGYLVNTLQSDTSDLAAMIEGGKHHEIALNTSMPIRISYITCEADTKGRIYFYKDIYGNDQVELREFALNMERN
jgi:murein L,D-transpeptidase YcbB/YkuD